MCGHLKTGHRGTAGTSGFLRLHYQFVHPYFLLKRMRVPIWSASCVGQTSRRGHDGATDPAWP